MNFKYFISFLFFMNISCQKKEKSLVEILSSNCFWDYWNKNESIISNSSYKFNKSGVCHYYDYKFDDNKKRTDTVDLYEEGDQILPKKWEIIDDSILIVQGWQMKIEDFNIDTIFLKTISNDTVYLIRNCKTVARPPRYP